MNQLFLFVLWPAMLVTALLSARVRRPVFVWTFVLFPPLCLASLWWIPLGRGTMHFIWVPALFAAGLALISVLVMSVVGVRERLASSAIRDDVAATARQIQEACEVRGACPEALAGWKVVEENPTFRVSERTVRRLGREATLRYENMIPARQFTVRTNYYRFAWHDFHGGVDTDLKPRPD